MPHSIPTARSARAEVGERGTALVMVPALALVLVVLGAVAIDLAVAHAAQRSAVRVATAAADDAAGMIDRRAVQLDGVVRIDPVAADLVARARIRTADLPGPVEGVEVHSDASSVEVVLRVRVPHVFLDAVPGGPGSGTVPIRVRARMTP